MFACPVARYRDLSLCGNSVGESVSPDGGRVAGPEADCKVGAAAVPLAWISVWGIV